MDDKSDAENPFLDPAMGARMDGWVNELTGVGRTSRTRFDFQHPIRMQDQALDDLYYGDPYAARLCDCVPEEALRGFTFSLDFGTDAGERDLLSRSAGGDKSKLVGRRRQLDAHKAAAALHQRFDTHHIPMKVREAWTWSRVWGGGFLLLGINDGQAPTEPLDLKAAKEFLFVASCDKTELQPVEWFDDPERPNYGEPRLYQLTRQAGVTVDARQIHATRVIRFDGSMTVRRRRLQNNSWSESVLQRTHGALEQFNAAYAAVSSLLQESSLRIVGIAQLAKMMAADGGNQLKQRLAVMDSMTSVARAVLYDKDLETVSRTEVGALTGLAEMLRMYMLFMAGAYHAPVTVLFGQSPSGLNATGESDMRLWYDRIDCDRLNYLKPKLVRMATILCACDDGPTGGVVPRIDVTFPSMYASTPAEDADIKLKTAQRDQIELTNQVVTPEEIALSRHRPEGWSAETEIDIEARGAPGTPSGLEEPTKLGGAAGGASDTGTETKDALGATQMPASLTPRQMDSAMAIVERVGARAISRQTGAAMLVSALPLTAQQAEAILGETGTTHFTTPEPKLLQEHEDLKTQLVRLQRSHDARKRFTQRVLAQNKAGQLWTGMSAHDDETDDDVREGAEGETTPRAMPEGPPFTHPRLPVPPAGGTP